MTLPANIHTLTRPHLTLDPNGKPEQTPAMLDELKAAATERRAGAPGNDGRSMPISTDAIALMHDIEFAARNEQYQRTGTDCST